jgi:MFS family permease
MTPQQVRGDGRRWLPWIMACTGMLVLLVSNGLTATALSVYDESLLNEFGWTRGELKFRDLVTFWLVALIAPFAGLFIDRLGPRRMLTIGCVLLSVGYVLYSRLDSLAMLYAIHVILALGLLGASTMTCVILISNWFYAQRGLAIGIALVGTSLGSIILSPVNALMIERFGWRQAFLIEAALPMVLLAVILAVVRNSPRDVGTVAHGLDLSAGRDLRLEGLTLAEAMRTKTFWAIGLSGMLIYYSILALYNHLFLYLRGLGFTPVNAGFALSLLGLLGLTGKLVNGALADRIDRHKVFLGCQVIMLVGVALLATQGKEMVLVAIAVIGLGWGGLFTLYNMLAVNNFGLRSAGKIGGIISLMESLGGGLGIWLTGVLYDRHDSYQQAFYLILGLVFAGGEIGECPLFPVPPARSASRGSAPRTAASTPAASARVLRARLPWAACGPRRSTAPSAARRGGSVPPCRR